MNREELTKLPGRPEEQAWLRERLEVLTVREGIALDAAIQRHPVQDSAEAVSLLAYSRQQGSPPGCEIVTLECAPWSRLAAARSTSSLEKRKYGTVALLQ